MSRSEASADGPLRHIVLEGADNLRDIGGFAASGGQVRWGAVYRSDSLCSLTDADLERVAKLNLRVAIDFRDQSEIEASGSDRLPDGVESDHISILEVPSGGAQALESMTAGSGAFGVGTSALTDVLGNGGSQKFMQQTYRSLVREDLARKGFGRSVQSVANTGQDAAALYHCHSGKDRTGWMTAIVLSILGTDQDVIFEDYLSSNDYLRASNEKLFAKVAAAGVDADLIRPLMEQQPEYLHAAFDAVTQDYGDMASYTREGLGISDGTTEAMRERLIS